jgi:glycosyltransferase involved in cell wall biosynthesis
VLAAAFAAHNWRKTWHTDLNMYIAPTQFVRQKFIDGGFPAEKIAVKPNFVRADPGERAGRADYALYVGRLSPEKGITTLLAAWKKLPKVPLRIVGDDPMAGEVERGLLDNSDHVGWLGQRSREETLDLIKGAMVLVFPSECYETFGRVAVEAFACDVPVIASRLGAVEEVVSRERTGLQFAPDNAEELATAMEWAWTHPREIAFMGRAAREEYKAKYTPETNYERLMGIYNSVIQKVGSETKNPGAQISPLEDKFAHHAHDAH